jgi:selenophosphate synthetase-related protein
MRFTALRAATTASSTGTAEQTREFSWAVVRVGQVVVAMAAIWAVVIGRGMLSTVAKATLVRAALVCGMGVAPKNATESVAETPSTAPGVTTVLGETVVEKGVEDIVLSYEKKRGREEEGIS